MIKLDKTWPVNKSLPKGQQGQIWQQLYRELTDMRQELTETQNSKYHSRSEKEALRDARDKACFVATQ